jgi:DNA-binding NtrC family response regulator
MELLRRHRWPFNVRELQQVVERAVCVVEHDVILPRDLPDYIHAGAAAPGPAAPETPTPVTSAAPAPSLPPLREIVEKAEREHILRALEAAGGNKRRAIEMLQISPETFYRRLEDFGLRKPVSESEAVSRNAGSRSETPPSHKPRQS